MIPCYVSVSARMTCVMALCVAALWQRDVEASRKVWEKDVQTCRDDLARAESRHSAAVLALDQKHADELAALRRQLADTQHEAHLAAQTAAAERADLLIRHDSAISSAKQEAELLNARIAELLVQLRSAEAAATDARRQAKLDVDGVVAEVKTAVLGPASAAVVHAASCLCLQWRSRHDSATKDWETERRLSADRHTDALSTLKQTLSLEVCVLRA